MCSSLRRNAFTDSTVFTKLQTGIKKGNSLEFMEIDSFMLNEISKSKINSMVRRIFTDVIGG